MNTVVFIVILLILLVLFYEKTNKSYTQNHVKIYRFYSPTCSFCIKSQAEWDKFKQLSDISKVAIYEINIDREKKLFHAMGGKGVPFITKICQQRDLHTYNGDRTANDLLKWSVVD